MNHIVPDFETDEEFIIPNLPNKSAMGGEEDIMELLWHNGQVVLQSQNQRSVGNKKAEIRNRENRSSVVEEQIRSSDVFMQEDEMASWLHYPIGDDSFENYLYGNDLNIYPAPPSSVPIAAASTSIPPPPPPSVIIPSRPPVPPSRRVEGESQSKNTNFLHFERANNDRSAPAAKAPESRASRISDEPAAISVGGGIKGAAGTTSVGREMETCDMSVTSSPGSGGSGASEPLCQKLPPSDDRKRKGIDADDNEDHTEDAEFEFADAKKQPQGGSTSTKKSRAAEVHNLSERRRRDRINEKMKALQELIPRCNKVDKASMLDEAIEYLKSLQMQVQMMSMGCNMVPMMFPGVQQYMPTMGMGMSMGMGMNMGMDMGMNRAMVPYPAIHPGSSLPNPAAAAHLSQRFAVPGYNMLPVTVAGPTASQAANMTDPMMNPLTLNSQNQPGVPNFADPFQHYLVLHQTQLPLPQNQGGVPQATDANNPDHHQTR